MMDFGALGESWRRDAPAASGEELARMIEATRARLATIDRAVRRRDRLETTVALVLVPIFAVVAWRTPHPVSAMGAAILAVACLLVPVRLGRARRRPPDRGLPMIEVLRAELDRVRAQQRLLGSVLWWYLLPLSLGAVLVVLGAPVSPGFKIGYALVVLAFGGFLYLLNRRAARAELEPVSRELEGWLAAATDTPFPGGDDA